MNRITVNAARGIGLALMMGLAGAPAGVARTTDTMVTCRIELDREVLPVGDNQTAVIKVTLDAGNPPREKERPPVNLAIVLDRSGSMSGRKLEQAKEAAIHALRRLNGRDLFSMVIYDDNVETIVPAQSAANTEWIEGRIRSIQSGNSTALFGGVSQGAAEIRKNLGGPYVHRVILLSDGLANVGPSQPDDLGRLGAALLKEGVSVSTVGVGTDYNEDLMANLSQNSDGNTYFVEDSEDLTRIFGAELGDVLSVVAKQVNLVIECPDGVEPVSVIGREGRIRGRNVELSLNQLYGGQEKYALVEIRIPRAKPGEARELATARVDYENALTQKRETANSRVSGRFSENPVEVSASEQPAVIKTLIINKSALQKEEAIRLGDEQKPAAAAAALETSARDLREAGAKYGDDDLIQRAADQEEQAEAIRGRGKFDASERKAMRASSYQDMNQQQNQ